MNDLNKNISNCEFKKYSKLCVYITGFGNFGNITDNPSEILIKKINENKENLKNEIENMTIEYIDVMTVNTTYVDENIPLCYSIVESNQDGKIMHLIVHFGVNAAEKQIRLETTAKNFICDEYKNCLIENVGCEYNCKLNLIEINDKLSSRGHNITLSNDAGNYLCNYIYYTSSRYFSNSDNVKCLFIHIPKVENISTNGVFDCFSDFLKCISETYIEKS